MKYHTDLTSVVYIDYTADVVVESFKKIVQTAPWILV